MPAPPARRLLPYVIAAARQAGFTAFLFSQLHCACTVPALKVHYPCMGNGPYSRWNTCMEINAFSISLAACPVLLLAAIAFLIFIAIGIRKGDLGDPSPAGSRISAITRRVTGVGIRNDEEGDS
jgi:hypothetical protein